MEQLIEALNIYFFPTSLLLFAVAKALNFFKPMAGEVCNENIFLRRKKLLSFSYDRLNEQSLS